MKPMEYGHYQDEALRAARRAMEDAEDQARAQKNRWLEELTNQAATDILNRVKTLHQDAKNALPDNPSAKELATWEDEVARFTQRDIKWLLSSLVNAVTEAERRIPSN